MGITVRGDVDFLPVSVRQQKRNKTRKHASRQNKRASPRCHLLRSRFRPSPIMAPQRLRNAGPPLHNQGRPLFGRWRCLDRTFLPEIRIHKEVRSGERRQRRPGRGKCFSSFLLRIADDDDDYRTRAARARWGCPFAIDVTDQLRRS